jgi:hypothetical protein
MLRNEIGNSFPYSSFWVSVVAREWLDAKVYNENSLPKFRSCNTSVVAMVDLNLLKSSFSVKVHLNYESFSISY